MPSSYYITNPLNTLKNNRAAGSDGIGFHYYFGSTMNRTNLQSSVLSNSENNIAHSNKMNGLRVNNLNLKALD